MRSAYDCYNCCIKKRTSGLKELLIMRTSFLKRRVSFICNKEVSFLIKVYWELGMLFIPNRYWDLGMLCKSWPWTVVIDTPRLGLLSNYDMFFSYYIWIFLFRTCPWLSSRAITPWQRQLRGNQVWKYSGWYALFYSFLFCHVCH